MSVSGAEAEIRIDKWLWAARFFKTRAQAAQAVAGGKVQVNGGRAKPARLLRSGDHLRITKEPFTFTVVVLATSDRRLSAPEAAKLYEESEESRLEREQIREERRLLRQAGPILPAGRPGKRDRRLIKQFIRKDE